MTFDADVTKIDSKEIKIYKVGETTAVHTIIGNDATGIVSITGNTVTIDVSSNGINIAEFGALSIKGNLVQYRWCSYWCYYR